jgi:hypothetical protein
LIKDGISVLEGGDTSDVPMSIIKVSIAGVAQALMPENAFGADAQFVKTIFLRDSMDGGNNEGRIIGMSDGGRGDWKEDRLRVAQTTREDAMKEEIFGRAKLVMDGESEGAASGMSVESRTGKVVRREKVF